MAWHRTQALQQQVSSDHQCPAVAMAVSVPDCFCGVISSVVVAAALLGMSLPESETAVFLGILSYSIALKIHPQIHTLFCLS